MAQTPSPTQDPFADELTLKDYVRIFSRHRGLILGLTLAGIASGLAVAFLMRPQYKATATVRLDTAAMQKSLLSNLLIPTSRNLMQTEIEVAKSRTIVENAIREMRLDQDLPPNKVRSYDEFLIAFRKKFLDIESPRNTDIIDVTGIWYDPTKAAAIANSVAQEYIHSNIQRKQAEAKKAREFLDEQIGKMKDQLRQGEQAFSLRETKVNEALYQSLLEKREEAQVVENGTIGDVWVVDPAQAPPKPFKPKLLICLLLGLVGGFVFATAFVSLNEHFDDTLHSPEEFKQETNIPMLATIPLIPFSKSGILVTGLKETTDPASLRKRLITNLGMNSPIVEAYRGLRTNLSFTNADKYHQVLLITSADTGEGKTLTTANLALVLAQGGQQVLVVDADMRRPMQHVLFEMNQEKGLSEFLAGQTSLQHVIRKTKEINLRVLPAGRTPPNPPDLLGSKKMADLFSHLRKVYDTVLIDSPPLLAVTDPMVLAKLSDGLILVARSNQTKRGGIHHAMSLALQTGKPVLGLAVNALHTSNSRYGYGGYNSYYGYSAKAD